MNVNMQKGDALTTAPMWLFFDAVAFAYYLMTVKKGNTVKRIFDNLI